MICAASFASPRVVDVLPTGVEPTGVEPTGVEPTGTSWSVSDGNDWPVVENPMPLSSIGVDPTGVEPTGDVKKGWVAGLRRSGRSRSRGDFEEHGDLRAARQAVEAHLVEVLVAADREMPEDERVRLDRRAVAGSSFPGLAVLSDGDDAAPLERREAPAVALTRSEGAEAQADERVEAQDGVDRRGEAAARERPAERVELRGCCGILAEHRRSGPEPVSRSAVERDRRAVVHREKSGRQPGRKVKVCRTKQSTAALILYVTCGCVCEYGCNP